MYIKTVHIKNIRSLEDLRMDFPQAAGWHVLLGENGSGKTSIIRAISAALVGPMEILRLDPTFGTWVRQGAKEAKIELTLERDITVDKRSGQGGARGGVRNINTITCKTVIQQHEGNGQGWFFDDSLGKKDGSHPSYYNWGTGEGWFSAAFGPYRRFTGGNSTLENFYIRNPKIGSHLTAFKEEAALTESVVWLKDRLLRSSLSNAKVEDKNILEGIKHFINQEDLLPKGFKLEEITADGPFFSIPQGGSVHLYELSEGIKSVTSLAFELLRLLLNTYSADAVFGNFLDQDPDNDFVPVKGVVLIDEIDVHLHPTWQARIGHWFTRCFPNLQFIVSTHSPIICRAAVKGSVWRLPTPNSSEQSPRRVEGLELQKLLYGDVLDAFGTGIFGHSITRSPEGHEKLERLATLNIRYYRDEATAAEKKERQTLLELFPSDDSLFSK